MPTSSVYPFNLDVIPDKNPGDIILSGLENLQSDAVVAIENTWGKQPTRAVVEGRLTLVSGKPVTTLDITGSAAATVYFTPFDCNRIGLYSYNGTNYVWNLIMFTETSLTLANATSGGLALSANTIYDVYAYLNGTAAAIDSALVAWNGSTPPTRGIQDGITVKNGDATRRLLGFIRTTANAAQTEDSAANRFVVNWSRAMRVQKHVESTDTANRSTASTSYVQVGSVQVSYVGTGDYFVDMQGNTMLEMSGGNVALTTIGSATNTRAAGATTASAYQATGWDIGATTTLREAQVGLVTRYLLFRSQNGGTVYARGDASGATGEGPSTCLKALVWV